ncbi:MCM-domain-containing protein [Coccomyxa subellipsoidea C-169]|uniref:DNA helicase n=1 Tax=Coccomyxa subellipsoidea (strain C-169) TaxID=574566 RepID=I0Z7P4_COCSC|nr:MCM-domain-containing protein [Coccomyxa subellipsoidea C-169]EIE26663.1 MCM-domain-containing protein [Coccomyxa subellipsoidea C-169]|eukprot:XP_005651207.1 MCM-domain-containing protein [Coccomyxa subellipsoidea C-169]
MRQKGRAPVLKTPNCSVGNTVLDREAIIEAQQVLVDQGLDGTVKFLVEADLAQKQVVLPVPKSCPSGDCKSTKFHQVVEESEHTDYQEIRVQEQAQSLSMGSLPQSMTVILTDDLADSCRPGDDVEVTGIVTRQWGRTIPGEQCEVDLTLLGNSLFVQNKRSDAVDLSASIVHSFCDLWRAGADKPLATRNQIVSSVCPQLYGLFTVKLALLLMLIGGVERVDESGASIRGQVHMLLVGDPGTGKSQLMKYAAKLSQRSVVTTGRGSSAAGLTVAAVKEGGQWALEAGALVLADGGLCCIDEFDGMRESQRATVHEAMEQQSVSVAKAGLVTSLSTKATVLGVTNPRASSNPRDSLEVITGLSGPLLSRFDLVMVLRDAQGPDWDATVSEHILAGHQGHHQPHQQSPDNATNGHSKVWTLEKLRQYICWVKETFRPDMSREAEGTLLEYWQMARSRDDRHAARSTVRMLESLVRLSQAHARLLARHTVTRQDAKVAIMLVESCSNSSSISSFSNVLQSRCPGDPDAEYLKVEACITNTLSAWQETLNDY